MFAIHTHVFEAGSEESRVISWETNIVSKFAQQLSASIEWWRNSIEYGTDIDAVHIVTLCYGIQNTIELKRTNVGDVFMSDWEESLAKGDEFRAGMKEVERSIQEMRPLVQEQDRAVAELIGLLNL